MGPLVFLKYTSWWFPFHLQQPPLISQILPGPFFTEIPLARDLGHISQVRPALALESGNALETHSGDWQSSCLARSADVWLSARL